MTKPSPQDLLGIYRVAALINLTDERIRSLLMSGEIAVSYYSPRGQEIVAAATAANLRPEDYVVTTSGHPLSYRQGVPLRYSSPSTSGRSPWVQGQCGPMHVTHRIWRHHPGIVAGPAHARPGTRAQLRYEQRVGSELGYVREHRRVSRGAEPGLAVESAGDLLCQTTGTRSTPVRQWHQLRHDRRSRRRIRDAGGTVAGNDPRQCSRRRDASTRPRRQRSTLLGPLIPLHGILGRQASTSTNSSTRIDCTDPVPALPPADRRRTRREGRLLNRARAPRSSTSRRLAGQDYPTSPTRRDSMQR